MEKIEWCKKCENRKFEFKQGIICGLTDEKPVFEENCPDFVRDVAVREYRGSDLRPNDQRARLLLSLIWIVLVLTFVGLISSALQYNLLQTALNGGEITNETADANDLREQAVAVVYIIAFIVSSVAFIFWFRRAYFNLHQRVDNLEVSEGWAAAGWFVPFVNLYRPYQIMNELYVETKKYLTNKHGVNNLDLNTKIVGLWWTLWIVNAVLGQIDSRLNRDAETLTEYLLVTEVAIVSAVFGIGLCVVTLKTVRDYSKAEAVLMECDKEDNLDVLNR